MRSISSTPSAPPDPLARDRKDHTVQFRDNTCPTGISDKVSVLEMGGGRWGGNINDQTRSSPTLNSSGAPSLADGRSFTSVKGVLLSVLPRLFCSIPVSHR